MFDLKKVLSMSLLIFSFFSYIFSSFTLVVHISHEAFFGGDCAHLGYEPLVYIIVVREGMIPIFLGLLRMILWPSI